MKDFAIFVSSSDNYSDIWDLFFDMFHQYWPEYKGKIYLQTQEKEYKHPNLNIICTHVGKLKYFGQTLRAGLDKIPEENILFIMIDYIFMGKVNHAKVMEYYQYFVQEKCDSLCLIFQNPPHPLKTDIESIILVLPPDRIFNYQIAFWKKSSLIEMALPHESPWTSEWYGSIRAYQLNYKIAEVANAKYNVFIYNPAGCLHQGKWLPDAIEFLKSINYKPIDYAQRGFYNNEYKTLKTRIKMKYNLIKHGLMGSYWYNLIRKDE